MLNILGNNLVASAPPLDEIVTSSLLNWWPMNENVSGPLIDKVGGYNLDTYMGQSLDYDGVVDYSLTPDPVWYDEFNGVSNLTIGIRLYRETEDGDDRVLGGGYYGRPCLVQALIYGKLKFSVYGLGSDYNWTSTNDGVIPTGQWCDIVIIFDPGNSSFSAYIDGVSIPGSWNITPPTYFTLTTYSTRDSDRSKLALGAGSDDGFATLKSFLNGRLSRAFVTSDVLSLDDARELLIGDHTTVATPSDGFFWILDDGIGTTTDDYWQSYSINHIHGAITNSWDNGSRDATIQQKVLGRGEYTSALPGIRFDGNGKLYANNASFNLPVGDITFEFWIKNDLMPSGARWLLDTRGDNTTSSSRGFSIIDLPGTGFGFPINSGEGGTTILIPTVYSSEWRHCFVTINMATDTAALYVATASKTSFNMEDSDTLSGMIGLHDSSQEFFIGIDRADILPVVDPTLLGALRLYNDILTSEEMEKNHKIERGNYA